jgi:hypothetical protein
MKTEELVKKCQDRMKSIRDKIETKRKSKKVYSEEEVLEMLQKWSMYQVDIELNKLNTKELSDVFRKTLSYKEWFEQFKKK